ncbi:TPA: hypothetical protein U2M35_002124 [Providencia rettgeri]|nr:hypothetical protein [Providencia rettgeri]
MFNVIRKLPAPSSLKTQTKYDGEDVYEALQECFHYKCYLCETKYLSDINIEHFYPHENDDNLKFSWDNLYYACSRCNNIKSNKFKNLLDCCSSELVWNKIKLLPSFAPRPKNLIVEAQFPDSKTVETAELLTEIYNNDNTMNKKITAKSLRMMVVQTTHKLIKQMEIFHNIDSTCEEKNTALEKIKIMINKNYPYSAFCRWMIKEDEVLDPLLSPLMD